MWRVVQWEFRGLQRVRGGEEARIRRMARRGGAGQARTATRAKPPLGAMSMLQGMENWALVPTPLRKPRTALPATVVVSRVARSMRRMLVLSCDAWGGEGGRAATYTAEEPANGAE